MIKRLILFLILNFGGLYLGSIFTTPGTSSTWYTNLDKAPWTPPGWVFGSMWTLIMICFSIYLAYAFTQLQNTKRLRLLFVISLVLNISWNPIFFYRKETLLGLFVIALLTLVVWTITIMYRREMQLKSLLMLPYGIWLLIATSLNLYIVLYN